MENIEYLLKPASIAVIGASTKPDKVGHEILLNLKKGGYQGDIIPINPKADEIIGYKAYPDLKSYGKSIDTAVIVVPAKYVLAAVKDAIAAKAGAVTIISAGFKEIGKQGADAEKEIKDLCSRNNVRILGPNCLGLINTNNHMNASFASHMPEKGSISIISQSGALCTAILDWAASRHLGIANIISMGNKADLSEIDFMEHFKNDNETNVIAGYLESIENGDKFVKAAEKASAIKPVVILKSGATEAGGAAASSHTGSLAGADTAYSSAFKRSGVIRAKTFEQLFDFSTALSMQTPPKGKNVAIITNAGGPGIMAADAVEKAGLKVCSMSTNSATALRDKLPSAASVSNPIDVLGDADPERYKTALRTAQKDKSVDAIIVLLTPQAMTKPVETAEAIADCKEREKPILVSFMGGADVLKGRERLIGSRIPDYPTPERAVSSLKAMYNYYEWLNKPQRVLRRFAVNRRKVNKIIQRDLKEGTYQIGESEAKKIFDAYGVNVLPGRLVADSDEAVAFAEKVGFPLAMKISSPDIIHKSDVKGVKLNLQTPEQVRDAFDLMMLRINRAFPEARLDGVYIEKMASPGREVIIGMKKDPQFGPILMFGLGGVFIEVMKDVTFNLAPITEEEAINMLQQTKSYGLLTGARGSSELDIGALVNTLQRMSQLVTDFPEIQEMDINPFIVNKPGSTSVAADGRITLSNK